MTKVLCPRACINKDLKMQCKLKEIIIGKGSRFCENYIKDNTYGSYMQYREKLKQQSAQEKPTKE